MIADAQTLFGLSPSERRFLAAGWLLAPPASFAVRRFQFRAVLDRVARVPARRMDDETLAAKGWVDIERGEWLVRAAFRRAPADARCLPQSIVQYLLHLRWGPSARLVIGVVGDGTRTLGDFAHAWVEAEAGPRRELRFVPILELSATRGVTAPREST